MMVNVALALLFITGAGINLVLAHSIFSEIRFGSKAQRFSGNIVDFESIRGSGNRMHAPVVEWIGPDGKKRRFRGADWYAWRRYVIGEEVAVLCGFDKEQLRVCLDSFAERFGFPFLLLAFTSSVFTVLVVGFTHPMYL